MIKVGSGQSSNPSTSQAVEEAAGQAMSRAGLNQADLLLVFFTVDYLPNRKELTMGLRQISKTDQIVGCSGSGVLTEEGEIEGKPGLAVLALASDRIKTHPFLFQPLRDRDRQVGEEIAQTIRGKSDRNSLLALFVDAYNGSPDRILQEVREPFGFLPIVGAGCSESGSQGKTYQLCSDQFSTNALSGLLFTGTFNSTIGVTQGCQPVSEPMVITKARENLIIEINNRPAFEIFADTVKEPLLGDLRRALSFVFVGLPSDPRQNSVAPGEYLVRNIVGLDTGKGILAVGEKVREGEQMIFTLREGQRAREDLDQMLQRQVEKLRGRSPQLGLYFNCCGRGTSLYGIPSIDTAYIRRTLGDFPLIGFSGNFELGPVGQRNHLLVYTGVLVLISEE